MTVTINTLGTNSRQIVIANETSATNIINAVNTCLTSLGWTLVDTVTSGSRGLLTTKVYSAPNADTVTTKYMIIRYDLHRQYWFTSCAENWNTTTNTATNECWYGNRQILLPLQYSNCTLYVFATARYACFMGTVLNEPSSWQGVFEFEREAPEDIAAASIPCFGWTSSLTIGEPYGNIVVPVAGTTPGPGTTSNANGFVACGFAPPRTINSLTGTAAAANFIILTTIGSYPPPKGQIGVDFTNGGVTQTINLHNAMLGSFGEGQSYVWNNTKTLISNIKLAGYSSNYVVGKIYGLKITTKLGNVLDTTVVPVDANLFYSATGSNTTHYLMGIHGGYTDKLATGSNRLQSQVTVSGTALGTPWQSVVVGGRFVYFTTSTGFHKFDAQTQGFTYNILPAAAYYAVKFDGENSLYVTGATANTVYKVNLSNDTYVSLTMTGSWSGLAIDDDNLYVASVTTGTTIPVKRVSLSTFTEAETFNITSPGSNYITHLNTADYSGYLYAGCLYVTTASSNRITRVLVADGSQNTLSVTVSLAQPAGYAHPIFYDSQFLWMISGTITASGSGTWMRTAQIRLSNFSLAAEPLVSATFGAALEIGNNANLYTLGCFEPISYAGIMLIPAENAANCFRWVFSDPRVNVITAIPANYQTIDTNTLTGQGATDGCNLYQFSGTTTIIKYNGAFRNYNFNGAQSSNLLIAQ